MPLAQKFACVSGSKSFKNEKITSSLYIEIIIDDGIKPEVGSREIATSFVPIPNRVGFK